ncbi:MAG: superoxide dismutase [Ferruginibacter sp.]|nr:superoxide dismutase [Chitinophagaceae bacterium]
MNNDFKKNRREFLKTTGKAGLAAGLSFTVLPSLAEQYNYHDNRGITGEDIPYEQQPLPYAYAALEPVIDAMTMELHYSKHAATYAKNLSDATKAEGVDTTKEKLTSLLGKISKFSPKMRNNGGGHYNHEFFWKSMKSPASTNSPAGSVEKAMTKDFGSFDAFKTQFADAGKNRFGSGWAWLLLTQDKKLVVSSTPNQDNPLMDTSEIKGTPLLGLDVWEHAYYLKYQNRRPDYITAWWNVVNWDVVQKRFEKAK